MIDICIPVYRNLKCLDAALRGLRAKLTGEANIIFNIQEQSDVTASMDIAVKYGFKAAALFHQGDMADKMNRMFSACTSDWVVFMEQDTFVHFDIAEIAILLETFDYHAAGPLDVLHYNNSNARHMPKYGELVRLSPPPGYFHSSLIFLNRKSVAEVSASPFSIPAGFKLFGHGTLGAESYYGLRINVGSDAKKLAFFQQNHAAYGYAASIEMNSGTKLATHLYYSSTKDGYLKDKSMTPDEHAWLCAEEDRFLTHYLKGL